MLILFILLEIVMVTCFSVTRIRGQQYAALILKALSSAVFLLLGIWALGTLPSAFSIFVCAGLLFGLLGDVWLDLRWIDTPHQDFYTFAGFGSFSAEHIVLLAGFFACFAAGMPLPGVILPLVIAAAAGVLIGLAGPLLKLDYGRFRGIIIFYAFCLCSVVLTACSRALSAGFKDPSADLFLVGSIFFLISDLILSGTYFGKGKDRPADVIANHTCYYLGQFLMALSLLFA